jgi:adenine-specific DNA-methyltransferase
MRVKQIRQNNKGMLREERIFFMYLRLVKAPFNYSGNKYKLLKQLLPLFPENITDFVDLFGGGFDVGTNVDAERVYYNEIFMPMYEVVKEISAGDLAKIIEQIWGYIQEFKLTKTNREGFEKFKEYLNNLETPSPVGWYTALCYSFNNMLCFSLKNGIFNTAFGEGRSSFNGALQENLIDFNERNYNRDIIFSNKSFEDFDFSVLRENSFVYCDPPYLISEGAYNGQNGKPRNGGVSWTVESDLKLMAILDNLNENGVKWGMSNVFHNKGLSNEKLINWAEKYSVEHLDKTYKTCSYQRKISDNADTDEVFICNYEC